MFKIDYSVKKKNRNLLKSMLLVFALLSITTLSGQTILTGSIIDAKTKESLPGVTISVKNTTIGAISDEDGKYELKLSPGNIPS